jgi:Holliday junction resolvase RusA-like endonuclease
MKITVKIDPIGKPRMTRQDKWKQRPCVMRYRSFADNIRAQVGKVPDNAECVSWVAFINMPKSWSQKKKDAMRGQLHRQKPDRDNIDKAILDALFKDDSGIAAGTLCKRWDDGKGARIELEIS